MSLPHGQHSGRPTAACERHHVPKAPFTGRRFPLCSPDQQSTMTALRNLFESDRLAYDISNHTFLNNTSNQKL
jgi:NifB/MoaA-like Fe-S oxidoreductase